MSDRWSGLASRFRQAIADERSTRASEDSARQERLAAAIQAREALFEDLVAFAGAIGFVTAQREADGVTLRYRDRALQFQARGEGDGVRVAFEGAGDDHRLYREPDLGNKWVYARRKRWREERIPLFDAGLEELLVVALGLPKP